ncbi:Fc.00g083730.m01.CDS01 [Cosmosporella sp. VM-42]
MKTLKLTLLGLISTTTTILATTSHILRADDVLIRPYIALPQLINRRATANSTDAPLTPSDNLNLTAWDSITNAACLSALSSLRQSSNPSGTCICYNLPSLDTSTGIFEADLRLFKISESRGAWAGIPPENIKVGLRYSGATVSPVTMGNDSDIGKRDDNGPELMKAYMFVGQIDGIKMKENMTMAALEALVMPILTLTAKNTTGFTLSTNVSTNEAAFLAGVFADEVVQSDFGAAQAAVADQMAGLKNGTVAFVLPGVQLMIFPVGLIITSVWLVIGLAAYGFGTYERMGYAEMYKRRQAFDASRGKTF